MVKKVLLALVVLIGGFLAYVATLPSEFKITRTGHVKAPAEVAFSQIADFHKWEAWSPWEKLDASMKKTYAGNPSGTGAQYSWVGNDKVGEGKMTIVNARSPNAVILKIEFLKPWQATNTSQFIISAKDSECDVTWSMMGNNNFGAKLAGVFMNMDKLVGDDFEKGLAALSLAAEAEAKKAAAAAAATPPADAAAAAPAPSATKPN